MNTRRASFLKLEMDDEDRRRAQDPGGRMETDNVFRTFPGASRIMTPPGSPSVSLLGCPTPLAPPTGLQVKARYRPPSSARLQWPPGHADGTWPSPPKVTSKTALHSDKATGLEEDWRPDPTSFDGCEERRWMDGMCSRETRPTLGQVTLGVGGNLGEGRYSAFRSRFGRARHKGKSPSAS